MARSGKGKRWSVKEDTFIRENYAKMNDDELSSHLRGRTKKSVALRRYSLKLTKRGQVAISAVEKRTGVAKTSINKKSHAVRFTSLKPGLLVAKAHVMKIAVDHWQKGDDTAASQMRELANSFEKLFKE